MEEAKEEKKKSEGPSAGRGIGVAELLSLLEKSKAVELKDVEIVAEELTFELLPVVLQAAAPAAPPPAAPPEEKPLELERVSFEPLTQTYVGEIAEVQIGATSKEGGTRSRVIKIGGEKSPPFYRWEQPTPWRPVVALDVFGVDILPPLPKTIKQWYMDVMDDRAAWAEKCMREYGADLVTFHLISTDPSLPNSTPAPEAAKFIDKMADKISDPFMIGSAGDPNKDLEVLQEVSKVVAGERVVFASVTLDMDLEASAKALTKSNLDVIALAFLDINQVKELNSKLLDLGVPKNNLITDPSTGGLGYGLEYTFSMMERMRLAGLKGDPSMQVPISCAATNAWAAREAWAKIEEWGPREYRGPIWEAVTGLAGMLAGADLLMMMHPLAAKIVKNAAEILSKNKLKEDWREIPYENWVAMKI
ncbi:MAG: CO dehydrogenase/acetyl-CoA synthase subunit delta [Candidatus Hecatellales archaeon]|nr:MAG: CO dehydrogenase/acetyl-CoA synthase subunit delta [Candidatus Hecatellales archaeon]